MPHSVLIIDDDPAYLGLLRQLVGSMGYEARVADSAERGLESARKRVPDLVVLDLEMPRVDGIECLRRLRLEASLSKVPVLILTALPTRDAVLRLAKMRIDGMLVKSDRLHTSLRERLRAILRTPAPSAGVPDTRAAVDPLQAETPGAGLGSSSVHVGALGGGLIAPPASTTPPPGTRGCATPESDRSAPRPLLPASPPAAEPARADAHTPLATRAQVTERVLKNLDELRAMSPAAREVLSLTSSAAASLEQVSRAIRQDQALSIRVLKLANSSLYSRGERVDRIQKAVARIGLSAIRNAVMSMGVLDELDAITEVAGVPSDWFWEHSLACGLLASRIAAARGAKPEHADTLFTAGLLHDVGRVVLSSQMQPEYGEVVQAARREGAPMEVVESRLLQIDHTGIAEMVLSKWKFARELLMPISLHHAGPTAIRNRARGAAEDAFTVALADRLAHAMALGSSSNDVLYPFDEHAEALGMSLDGLRSVCENVAEETVELRAALMTRAAAPGNSCVRALRGEAEEDLSPLLVCAPDRPDPMLWLWQRLWPSPCERPTVVVASCLSGADRPAVMSALEDAASTHAADGMPPVLIVAANRSCAIPEESLPAPIRGSAHHIVGPVRIDRLLAEMRALNGRPAAAAA